MAFKRLLIALACVGVVLTIPLIAVCRLYRACLGDKSPRSIWTGAPIINMAVNAKAERLLGARTLSIVRHTYFITSRFDVVLTDYVKSELLGKMAPFAVLVWICCVADRVHAYCDGGILPGGQRLSFNRLEMGMYRLFSIPVIVWTYGADVRTQAATRQLGDSNCCIDCTQQQQACICDDSAWQRNLAYLKRNTAGIFSMGDMIEYTPGSINNLFFWPIDFELEQGRTYAPHYPVLDQNRPLRVVHAPNHREFKGTRYLEDAVRQLVSEGVPIELVLVERISNTKALEIYKTADIIFDQCLIGFHGYFAVEAMALGKPVMCFIRRPEAYLIDHQACPMININTMNLKHQLKQFATSRRHELPAIGQQSRAYTEQHFSLAAFAQRLQAAYTQVGVKP